MRKKMAIIVPFRNREEHLSIFIPYMHRFLGKQYDFKIIVVEQCDNRKFNKGTLMNIGFDIMKNKCDYFCFHDIDLLPIENSNYDPVDCPTHLCARLDYYNWVPLYENAFGGVVIFNKEDFIKVNGFSNDLWGWGCEDDDMFYRCVRENLRVERRWNSYKGIPHVKAERFGEEHLENRDKLLKFRDDSSNYGHRQDGLSNLKYKILSKTNYADPSYLFIKTLF